MKYLKMIVGAALLSGFVASSTLALAQDAPKADSKTENKAVNKSAKLKAYPLKTCVVSDEKLGDMGDPHVFAYKDREIKLCCEGCQKKFDKEPAKYIKKLEKAEKAAPKTAAPKGAPHSHGDHDHKH